jgi:FkbM family methyltransferase
MSTKYFILAKPKNKSVNDNTENQIIYLNNIVHILPQVNMDYYIKYGLFESNLIEWVTQFCKNKTMLDIGSHSGTYAISCAKYCDKVYAFEPQKMTYYSLCGSVALSNINNIECINFGLGSDEQVGTKQLNIVSNDGGGSSLINNTNVLSTENIEVRTLDSFNIKNIGFIKMDVEDNELNVLKGAVETLKQSNYPKILFESNKASKNSDELFNYLTELNYKIISINGFNNMFLASYD